MTVPETLADRLSKVRMPAPVALRYAALLGEELRKLHDCGRAHGNISPASIVFIDGAIHLTPAPENPEDPALDAARDISAFGAVLYEMLTGEKTGGGEGASVPAPTGIPAADRLIAGCLAQEPHGRLLSMQKVLLELKLLTVAVRSVGASGAVRSDAAEATLRTEIQGLESRLAARLEERDKGVFDRLREFTEALDTLRSEFATLERNLEMVEVKQDEEILRIKSDVRDQVALIESVRASMAQTEDLMARMNKAVSDYMAHERQAASIGWEQVLREEREKAADWCDRARAEHRISTGWKAAAILAVMLAIVSWAVVVWRGIL